MAESKNTGWELRGTHVLAMVVAFFGFLIIANVAFIRMAVETHRGEDVPKSYRQGLDYNTQIARRQAQADLDWVITLDYNSNEAVIDLHDANGVGISGLKIKGLLRHPVDRNEDIVLTFEDAGLGRYVARFPEQSGRWMLRAEATNAPMALQSELKF